MRASAVLMAAGADQQLVAQKLEEPQEPHAPEITEAVVEDEDEVNLDESEEPKSDDGTLEISHGSSEKADDEVETMEEPLELPGPQDTEDEEIAKEEDAEPASSDEEPASNAELSTGSRIITEKPQLGGMLTANTMPEQLDPSVDPLSMMSPGATPILNRTQEPIEHKAAKVEPLVLDKDEPESAKPAPEEPAATMPDPAPADPAPTPPALTPPPTDWVPPAPPAQQPEQGGDTSGTLADIEKKLRSPADTAREEVDKALSAVPGPVPPKQDLNAQMLGDPLHANPISTAVPNVPPMDQPVIDGDPTAVPTQAFGAHQDDLSSLNLNSEAPAPEPVAPTPEVKDSTAPPPVPPPLPPFDPAQFSAEPTPPVEQPKP